MYTTNIQLVGLTCEACTKLAKRRFEKIDGIKEVDVQLSGETRIESERIVTEDEIRAALEGSNYEVRI